MVHSKEQLLNWLTKAAKNDILLLNALNDSGTRVELLGMFDPLPGSEKSGWLIRLITRFDREELIAIVKDHLGRPDHIFFAPDVDWSSWQGPNADALIGGDNGCGPVIKTKVVHCKRQNYDVLIDRTTKFGNPFVLGKDGSRDVVCDKHDLWLDGKIEAPNKQIPPTLKEIKSELTGKKIACWCSPQRCHGDNYVRRIHGEKFDMIQKPLIKSVGTTNKEIIQHILDLHTHSNNFDLDPCFSLGKFYKGLTEPTLKFDINPQRNDVKYANSIQLPILDSSISSIMFDPPFCFGGKNGPHGGQGKERRGGRQTVEGRFGLFWNFEALSEMYQKSLVEMYRILKPKGILIFKCQDYTDSKTTMTHCYVWEWAKKCGFYPKDLFILTSNHSWYVKGRIQRHSRKTHCYFWVFEKKRLKETMKGSIGGDNSEPRSGKSPNTSKFHRIERCAGIYTQKDRSAGDNTAGKPLDKRWSNPPNVPPSTPPVIE